MGLTQHDISVLVVDDSAFMRKAITIMLESDPGIKVIGSASNGLEGLEMIQRLKPDLVTMDIEMPRMDGLTALKKIMEDHPVPVMMLSSTTEEGARATLEALELGAVDFIPKQLSNASLDIMNIKQTLICKIKEIHSRRRTLMAGLTRRKKSVEKYNEIQHNLQTLKFKPSDYIHAKFEIVAIGTSTGGPVALQKVIPNIPVDFPVGILIAQHMPKNFTKSLAERLNEQSKIHVKEAEDGEPVVAGAAYIAPGGRHMSLERWGKKAEIRISDMPCESPYKPSVDILMDSVAKVHGEHSLGIIMTGMGRDGLEGLEKIKARGGKILAQNENSCVVYGMPRVVIEKGLADKIVPLDNLAAEIVSYFKMF